jgi:hypothetical protein
VAIDRREAVRRVAALLGGTLVGGSALAAGCRPGDPAPSDTLFEPADIAFLDEVAETIIPATTTPGAKAARVGQFMAVMVTDCYDQRDQQIFREGLRQLDAACRAAHSVSFMKASPEIRTRLLTGIDREAKEVMDRKPEGEPSHYFRMIKELTLLGYFTSEIGSTEAQRYQAVPGRWDPCLDYRPGERAWTG